MITNPEIKKACKKSKYVFVKPVRLDTLTNGDIFQLTHWRLIMKVVTENGKNNLVVNSKLGYAEIRKSPEIVYKLNP